MTDMKPLAQADPTLAAFIAKDAHRQRSKIQLIASENFVGCAMTEASGSVLANTFSECYSGRRSDSQVVPTPYVDPNE
jgi:glycine hydroxymethyltransferase